MAGSQSSREALYEAIQESAEKLKDNFHEAQVPKALLDLAYAWRALDGGVQPGSSVIEK